MRRGGEGGGRVGSRGRGSQFIVFFGCKK
jgi:hypothetical protein